MQVPAEGAVAVAWRLQQELRSWSLVDDQERSVIRGAVEAVCSPEGEVLLTAFGIGGGDQDGGGTS